MESSKWGTELSPGWLAMVADPTRLHILRSLSDVEEATAADLRQASASNQTLRRHLDALVSVGLIDERPGQSDGETPGRPAARFSLDPGVRMSVVSVFASLSQSASAPPPAL
jgi:DNA-binding transcriptional ArsR family regulator